PGEFQCAPGDPCFPREWLCDGHPDCEDDEDGRAQSQCPDQGSEWISACALSSPGLLSILVAASSVAVWGLSKAKHRSDIFGLEKASREQLMPDQSQ
ncbi:RSVR protein, partial [Edolisoma coerulescens]|nr:RSVR protein [Edolisoma coerulescens]